MCNKEWVNTQTGKILTENDLIELHNNAILKIRPELWIEWDFEKNEEIGLNIWKMTKALKVDSHWICPKGHNFSTKIANRGKGGNCRICNGKEVLIGYNDIYTTNKEVALLMVDKENMYKYTKNSDNRVDFKCKDCGTIKRSLQIKSVNKYGIRCVVCSDGYSYPEKIMYSLLNYLNIDFTFDKKMKWSKNRRYDFYIPSLNAIVEMHGGQHYDDSFNMSNRNDKEIDLEKRIMALNNGIENYIEIDCRISELEYIKNNIIENLSELLNLNDVNWKEVSDKSIKSMMIKVLELWNSGLKNVQEISNILKIHEVTIYSYLKKLEDLGKCEVKSILLGNKRKVVQLTTNGDYVNTFDSIYEASYSIGGNSHQNIVNVCKGKRNVCKGYNWMYEDDYMEYKNNNKIIPLAKKKQEVPIVQLSKEGEYIKEFISRAEAYRETGVNVNSIRRCCQGTLKSAGGYKWMNKDDYEKLG